MEDTSDKPVICQWQNKTWLSLKEFLAITNLGTSSLDMSLTCALKDQILKSDHQKEASFGQIALPNWLQNSILANWFENDVKMRPNFI